MESFEQACAAAEKAATAVEQAAKEVVRAATAMRKAAQDGDPAKIRKGIERLQGSYQALEVVTGAALKSWVIGEEEIQQYLSDGYQAELIEQGRALGLTISTLDDRLTAFPVVIQIQPSRRALRLDAKRVTALRPSRVVEAIRAQQNRARSKPEQVIEMLYRAYRRMVNDEMGKGVTLVELYDVLTLHPEAKRAYSKADFTRDVFLLDTSGVRKTNAGAVVSFPAATGTKGSSKVLTIVPPGGMPKHYYAIRFEDGSA